MAASFEDLMDKFETVLAGGGSKQELLQAVIGSMSTDAQVGIQQILTLDTVMGVTRSNETVRKIAVNNFGLPDDDVVQRFVLGSTLMIGLLADILQDLKGQQFVENLWESHLKGTREAYRTAYPDARFADEQTTVVETEDGLEEVRS